MAEIIRLKKDKNKYTCTLPLTKQDWIHILNQEDLVGPVWMRLLLSFYFMPEHKATCTQCAEKYGYHPNTYNSGITALGKAILRKTENSFSIVDENDTPKYWPVIMGVGRVVNEGSGIFEWQLRKELVEALESMVIENAIRQYASDSENHWNNEKYKWQAVKWFQEHWDLEDTNLASMIDLALGKTGNLLASMNSFPRGMITNFAKVAPLEVKNMFINLFDESLDLVKRVNKFMQKAEEIREQHNPGDWNMHYQSTNAISTYLWLRYPEKYYIYKYSEYREVARKLGLEFVFKKNGQPVEMTKGFMMYDMLNNYLRNNEKYVASLRSHLVNHSELHSDSQLRTATIDFGFWVSRWFQSTERSLHINKSASMTPFISQAAELIKNKKNIILQGAPGTGKTYNTAALALAIIDGNVPESHDEIMARYEQLRNEKRIGFTTFHQSIDYEDFIEGIKPIHEAGSVRYDVVDGIFKNLCNEARDNVINSQKSDSEIVRQITFEKVYEELLDRIENSEIDTLPLKSPGKLMKIESVSDYGNIIMKTIGTEKDITYTVSFDRIKPILEAFPEYESFKAITNINNTFRNLIGGCHSSSIWAVLNYLYSHKPKDKIMTKGKIGIQPYVLIIDEINRANVSKVFGELITLIEKDKRLGAEHPVTLSLPYSKQSDFGVPQNVYIIGTMNTTDRSTGTLDYAIRRRFAFLTIPAQRDIIKDATAQALFDDVKTFIERNKYADMDLDDLMVGHSYFLAADDAELGMKIKFEVIPLIKEYIKDGILNTKRDEAQRYFDSWLKLLPLNDNNSGTSEN